MNWSLQMVMALEFVHKKDVLHRDIKPSNILLFEDGRVLKLCDFGTARKLEHTLTNAVGTSWYMAPEVIRGTSYMASCDVYSFGVVLWEMITRHKPYLAGTQGKSMAPQSVMYRVATGIYS
jgi:mitogen-activated protein kinase kinase kinase 7